LRSPLSSFLSLAEYMADESASMTMDEMKNMANVARNSAKILFDQLENLLEWSRMQMAAISVDPVILDLWTAVDYEVDLSAKCR
jgi:two-component system, cell cycle sensor histidine kinase DivJ